MTTVDAADDGFFSTIGLPVVNGRAFARTDTAGSPRSRSCPNRSADSSPTAAIRSDNASAPSTSGGRAPVYPEIIGVVPDLVTR